MITTSRASKTIPHVVLIILALACVLPVILLTMASVTDEHALARDGYGFFPAVFSMAAYEYIFAAGAVITRAYGISFFVTTVGTFFNIVMTVFLAYPLSRPEVKGRNVLAFIIFFALLFNGGLVPTFMVYTRILNIRDTIWALIVPTFLMSPFLVIMVRNYFRSSIPEEIMEAAKLDGASEVATLLKIVLPISKPIIGTVGLMAGIAYWNDWTNGLYYLVRRTDLYNIQNVLTNMMNNVQFLRTSAVMQGVNIELGALPSVSIRMAIAVVGLVPVMIVYPFIQKSFIKGIVIGGIKG